MYIEREKFFRRALPAVAVLALVAASNVALCQKPARAESAAVESPPPQGRSGGASPTAAAVGALIPGTATRGKLEPGSKSAEPDRAVNKASQGLGVRPGYRIGAGDVLSIHVWKEPEASAPEVMVRSDGKISLPIIKEVEALGLTPTELERVLGEKIGEYIHGPEVTVLVKEINSEKVYLVGAVKKEGSIALQSPITVLQALAEAGGLTDFAKRKKIYILRNQDHKQLRLLFDYDAVLKGERMEQNVQVLPGDTIVIPQ